MLAHQTKPSMIAVNQPSRHLTQHDCNALEINLVAAMLSKAAAQQSAQTKQVAL